ncbi:MAG TPA: GNAT family N-acetyltransferase [Candidatus Limnocylindria bacterium]|nr:GNAT family N-acetyltransferase [Candidatus Limnocylindria bacterium]
MQTDAAAMAAEVPGLVVRPYAGPADHPDLARIQNAEYEADGVRGRVSVPELDAWLRHPSERFDPNRNMRVAEVDGRPVAYEWVDWVDTTDGLREYRSRGFVEPAFRRRGIGGLLWADGLRRIVELAASHDTERPTVLGTWTPEGAIGAHRLAERHGLEPVRWFFDMERRIDGDLPAIPPLPEGIEVRPVTAEDGPRIWDADHDAFRDHWGGFDDSEAAYRRWAESPEFEPSLFIVAFEGDEIAGAVLNAIYPEENEELGIRRGWLDSVFTRRAWRRRGLARALIVRAFALLRERGMEIAALGVDADNPSGALGLYESVGFSVTERMTAWRRPLEEVLP